MAARPIVHSVVLRHYAYVSAILLSFVCAIYPYIKRIFFGKMLVCLSSNCSPFKLVTYNSMHWRRSVVKYGVRVSQVKPSNCFRRL